MDRDDKKYEIGMEHERGPYDSVTPDDEDLWFLPAPPEDTHPGDFPWEIAHRASLNEAQHWRDAETKNYRKLVSAVAAVARLGARLEDFPQAIERLAVGSVTTILRAEGIWLSAEQIALYQLFRGSGLNDVQDLARARWAMRRLNGAVDPRLGLHAFLGRAVIDQPQDIPGMERPIGEELLALSHQWSEALEDLHECHAITRAGFAFAHWRMLDVAPFEHVLEPAVAAMLVGGGGLVPFLPLGAGYRFDRAGDTAARLAAFYTAVENGALNALMAFDQLRDWQQRAMDKTANLSGRTPALLIAALIKHPLVSVEIAAKEALCSGAAARRNIAKLQNLGLVREVTGQARYQFWTAKL